MKRIGWLFVCLLLLTIIAGCGSSVPTGAFRDANGFLIGTPRPSPSNTP
jgi:hypothetical protein